MVLEKKDFIEIEFTGKLKEGGIFDSNIKKDLELLNSKKEPKPFIFCLGEGMFLKAIDDFLIGKEIGKYTIHLSPEESFGKRNASLIKIFPRRVFEEHKLNPIPGITFSFDGRIAKVISASGGRVVVDFNNPLAGKDITYDINILRKVEDLTEKVSSFNEFLFQKPFEFELEENKIVLKVEKELANFVELFKEKYKEMFGFELEVITIPSSGKESN